MVCGLLTLSRDHHHNLYERDILHMITTMMMTSLLFSWLISGFDAVGEIIQLDEVELGS